QERPDDGVVRAAVHNLTDREFGLRAGERAPVDERLQRAVESAHRAFPSRSSRSRKFFSRCLPSKVRIDSGWNWTPSTACCLWRSPMISFSAVRALTSNAGGIDAASTSSE